MAYRDLDFNLTDEQRALRDTIRKLAGCKLINQPINYIAARKLKCKDLIVREYL